MMDQTTPCKTCKLVGLFVVCCRIHQYKVPKQTSQSTSTLYITEVFVLNSIGDHIGLTISINIQHTWKQFHCNAMQRVSHGYCKQACKNTSQSHTARAKHQIAFSAKKKRSLHQLLRLYPVLLVMLMIGLCVCFAGKSTTALY